MIKFSLADLYAAKLECQDLIKWLESLEHTHYDINGKIEHEEFYNETYVKPLENKKRELELIDNHLITAYNNFVDQLKK